MPSSVNMDSTAFQQLRGVIQRNVSTYEVPEIVAYVKKNWQMALKAGAMRRQMPHALSFAQLEEQSYDNIGQVMVNVLTRDQSVFWNTMDQIAIDPVLGPVYAIGFIIDYLNARPEYRALGAVAEQRYAK